MPFTFFALLFMQPESASDVYGEHKNLNNGLKPENDS